MILVTVFLSILNQMELHMVQNEKENSDYAHIPCNWQGIVNVYSSSCAAWARYLMRNCPEVQRLTHLCRPVRSTFAVRETASLGIMGAPRVPPLNPSESIVLSVAFKAFAFILYCVASMSYVYLL